MELQNRLQRGRSSGGGVDWELGISRYKLLYIEWISNKALLYGTGNQIQYPVINPKGKEYAKNMYTYIGLAKRFNRVFPQHVMEKPSLTNTPQYSPI